MNIKKNGFTLIELLVVISIIGILMGLLISQLGGVLGSSENTKMQAVLRSWIIQSKEYKNHYGYFPPFMYQLEEGTPISLNDPLDNQEKFFYALKGSERSEAGWGEFLDENKEKKEFHTFTEDEFDADGNLVGFESVRILVDYDRDGMIKLGSDVVDEILASLTPDYDEDEISLVQSRIEQFSVINEEIAFFILSDEISGVSNVYSWNLEKYFD
jgi:prepilin-type N-terminal cleavage/methylation domain-containing protein